MLTSAKIAPERIAIFIISYSALAIILIFRLAYLQLYYGDYYFKKAASNHQALLFESPPRALIYDRHDRALVRNQPRWDLYLQNGSGKLLHQVLNELKQIRNDLSIERLKKRFASQPPFEPFLILSGLSNLELAELTFIIHSFPQLTLKQYTIREYPYSHALSHLIGYTQPVTLPRFIDENSHQERAISGIEKSLDHQLKGSPSIHQVLKNAKQYSLDSNLLKSAIPGDPLKLTIDLDLQLEAYNLFEKHKVNGALIAQIPKTGEILVLSSYPGFDPNILRTKPRFYDSDSNRPMFFRATHGLYPPASLIKPIVALAGLNEEVIDRNSTIKDPGYYQIPGHKHLYKDWKKGGHGTVNVISGIAESCDTFFYWLGTEMGIDVMSEWFDKFGFGAKFMLPIEHKLGITPSREWKKKRFNKPWYVGESVITAIGQGYFSTTPLHLAFLASVLSTNGHTRFPSLLYGFLGEEAQSSFESIHQDHWAIIQEGMVAAIESAQGTAYRRLHKKLPFTIAGKTGTAQVVSASKAQEDHSAKKYFDHSLFLAYAPLSEPAISLTVVCEHQNAAVDIAKALLMKAHELGYIQANR